MAIPLGYPTPPREKVSLRSPLSDGDNTSSGTGVPIREATTEGRSLSWVLIDRSPGRQQSFCPRVSPPAVQPAGIINILLSTVQAHVPQKGGRAQAFYRPSPAEVTAALHGRQKSPTAKMYRRMKKSPRHSFLNENPFMWHGQNLSVRFPGWPGWKELCHAAFHQLPGDLGKRMERGNVGILPE